ncbi:helix-turn-helix domain-containing protein [Anaerotruncus rubiinfantis]|uniref:helix-turn-helix domain-containing protein n=1 Tax=Anaerotruncus rubiinfantis TaxID=1720200 RepID=UPI0034A4A123
MNRLPNRPQYKEDYKTFSEIVTQYMREKGITQAALAQKSKLSKTTISRICRDSNDKGSTYQADSAGLVMAVSVGLGLSVKEKDMLMLAAFPEQAFWNDILENHMDIDDANALLYEQGYPLLGNNNEE